MLKAIIFDLNGVFIQSPLLSERFEKSFGIPSSEFIPTLKEIMGKVRKANAEPAFVYWKPYLEKWKIDLDEAGFFDFWFSAEKYVPEVLDFARKLKNEGLKLFILSNNFRERANYYSKKFPFLNGALNEVFDEVYYSWQSGFVKPDPKAFENLLKENNLKPEECVYFDNSQENVDVAEKLGIKSYLFKGIETLQKIRLQET